MDSDKDQIDPQDWTSNTITINGASQSGTVLMSNGSAFDYNTLSLGPGFIAQDITTVVPGSSTLSGGYTFDHVNWSTTSTPMTLEQSGQLSLTGDNADIVINGVSLVGKLDAIAERLNILDVNPELEAEWDQLRELGKQYRQLEQELKTKSAMWNTLKTKTPNKPRT